VPIAAHTWIRNLEDNPEDLQPRLLPEPNGVQLSTANDEIGITALASTWTLVEGERRPEDAVNYRSNLDRQSIDRETLHYPAHFGDESM
jgi:hypothetical protein